VSARVGVAALLAAAALSAACARQTAYQRPDVPLPVAMPETPAATGAPSLGEAQWSAVFTDEALQTLIRTALAHNDNLQIAAARVIEAEAMAGIARADQLPSVAAGASALGQHTSLALGFPPRNVGVIQLQATAAWEADFWGRLKSLTAAARAQVLASAWAQRAVTTALVQQVADSYFRLCAFDASLDVAVRTLDTRKELLRLTQVREQGGATTLLDVRQAEQLVAAASLEIINLRRAMAQEEHLMSVLLGGLPAPVTRGKPLASDAPPAEVPPGLPSALLERRADLQQAESQLMAATAQIDAARALFFPRITLTGSGGLQSAALTGLFASGAGIWSTVASAVAPVFTAGRNRAQVAVAEARRDQVVSAYQLAVKQAFREVADALVALDAARTFRGEQANLLNAARDARRLSEIRYRGGAASYLEVLDADTRLFAAELGAAQARLTEWSAFVAVYRALGGGWQPVS